MAIKEGGYITFNLGAISDHRLIRIKISAATAFGAKYNPSKALYAWKIILNHTRGQQKYTLKLRHLTREYNLIPCIRQ